MAINSIAVFCGSNSGTNPLFTEHAKQLGYILAEKNITLIYGGGNRGLMGTVANALLEKNGKVIGIIPKLLTKWEVQHQTITELIVVDDMHIRKKMLYEKCDAAIILPGGIGTLDEFFEMLTWNQLKIHDKKIFLLNTNGFYDSLLEHIKRMQSEKFLHEQMENRVTILLEPGSLIEYLS
jgi:uncharacterized protein (TIGR00730 family)